MLIRVYIRKGFIMITQGKWTTDIVEYATLHEVAVIDEKGFPICLFKTHFDNYKDNAALIAVAPDLLAACKMLADALIHVEGDTKGNKVRTAIIPLLKGAANKGRQAIAKAEPT